MNLLASIHPHIIESTPNGGERQYDLYSRLMKDRIMMLSGVVDTQLVNSLIAQLLYLDSNCEGEKKPIHMYINSPGGSVSDGLALYDMMQICSCPIYTYGMGIAASMGSLLLTAGEKGHRYALTHARIMIHQPHLGNGGIGGQVTDIEIQARELIKTKEKLIKIYEKHSGKSYEELHGLMERDHYLDATEAIKLGLIDQILSPKK